jgi:hypothetical protein
MLGKLLKYEFKATSRIFLPMFGALLIVAAFSRLFMSLSFDVPSVIGVTVSVIMIIGIIVMTFLLTIQRFNKNLLGSEGYLMFTLPVSTDRLIVSKLITAAVWNISSVIIVFIAISIMAMTGISIQQMINEIGKFISSLGVTDLNLTLYIIEAIAAILLSLFTGILTLYACLALSLLVNKHRGLFAFGAYIVISIVFQTVLSLLVLAGGAIRFDKFYMSMQLSQQIHTGMGFIIIAGLISSAVFYIVTKLMLKYKLNLE